MIRRLVVGCLIALFAVAARAEETVTLKDGPGRDLVEGYCGTCHSLDYTRISAGFLNRKGWESEVDKMIKAYGAPIGAADAKIIVDYLTANYGSGGRKPIRPKKTSARCAAQKVTRRAPVWRQNILFARENVEQRLLGIGQRVGRIRICRRRRRHSPLTLRRRIRLPRCRVGARWARHGLRFGRAAEYIGERLLGIG